MFSRVAGSGVIALVLATASLTGTWKKTRNGDAIMLNWAPVPGATGYVIYRSTGGAAEFKWPANFLTALVETTYTDQGNTDKGAKVKGLELVEMGAAETCCGFGGTFSAKFPAIAQPPERV